jgi:flagellar biosynthesis protein
MSESPENTPDIQKKIAIALEYDFKGAPRVIAKGKGHMAETILDLARKHNVAIEENPLLAGALAQVELDDAIPEALYRAVANVLTFVLQARGELGRRRD